MTARRLARAAESLVGTPFRLHGRDPRAGLDCIGLFAAAMQRTGTPVTVPTGYTLRVSDLARWLPDPAMFTSASSTSLAASTIPDPPRKTVWTGDEADN